MVTNNIGLKRTLFVFVIFIINGIIAKKNVDKCESCDKLVKNFIKASEFEN